jgi:hypothetical protein
VAEASAAVEEVSTAVEQSAVVEDSTVEAAVVSHQARKKTGAPPSPLILQLRWEAIRLIPNGLVVPLLLLTLKP